MPLKPQTIAGLVNAALMLAAGVYLTLLGHRVIGKRPGVNLQYDLWHDRYAPRFRRWGPLLILAALFFAAGVWKS